MRLYTWRNQNVIPVDDDLIDYMYDRFFWTDFVSSDGSLNFSKLHEAILTSMALGRLFAFRVRPMAEVGKWYIPANVPQDWNNQVFLDAYRNLIFMLADYLKDNNLLQYIAWIDIAYGSFGEGADTSSYTDKTLMHLVDTYLLAFPETRLLIPAKTRALAICYFFIKRPWTENEHLVGIRIDNFGCTDDYFDDILPFLRGLFCAGEFRNPDKMIAEGGHYDRALTQVLKWDAEIGNGNLPPWSSLTSEQRIVLLEMVMS